MTISELQAENERLKAERDYCQRYYHDVVVEAKRLKAERDAALRSVQVLMESSADNLRLAVTRERERDETRAERDALTITSEEAGDIIRALTVERDEALAQAARLAEALRPFVQSSWKANKEANLALASTDARKWLREEKAKELEAMRKDMRKRVWIPSEDDYQELKDGAVPCWWIDERIAELRRKD